MKLKSSFRQDMRPIPVGCRMTIAWGQHVEFRCRWENHSRVAGVLVCWDDRMTGDIRVHSDDDDFSESWQPVIVCHSWKPPVSLDAYYTIAYTTDINVDGTGDGGSMWIKGDHPSPPRSRASQVLRLQIWEVCWKHSRRTSSYNAGTEIKH